ncbi:MAG TPA: hypothetical protein VFW65_35050 [Pseudonocardiaceae bacterium]|nr:hypothetical protein [Pseudonocardiaceae bacterium]
MRHDHWFSGDDQAPGEVLFRTDRTVQVWTQTPSHRQLLLRAIDRDGPTRLDLLFTNVERQCLHTSYDGLVVRRPTGAEHGFLLECGGIRDHVAASGFGWQEDELTNFGPDSLPARMAIMPFEPPWPPGGPDFPGYPPSGPVVPLGELVDALLAGSPAARDDGFRYVHVVVLRTTRTLPDGREIQRTAPVATYLTRADAEAAIRAEVAARNATIARAEQPSALVQDTLMARTLTETKIERWVVPVPVQL